MDAPPSNERCFPRRSLFRIAGAGLLLGLTAEGVRVFALTNEHVVIRGRIYRSAQLSPDELAAFIAEHQIRTVLNLRGTCRDDEWYRGEARTTHAASISQEDIGLSAKRLPAPNEIRRLVEVLDRAEYPIVLHCQRGADRTGLVATAALLLHTDATLDRARRQLGMRYGHIRGGRTVVIDRFFDFYEAWLSSSGQMHSPDRFRHWAVSEYCPGPYRAQLSLLGSNPPTAAVGRGFTLPIRAVNASLEPWSFRPGAAGGIQLRYRLYSASGEKLYTGHAGLLAATIEPGERIDLTAGFPPIATPGRYLVHADLLDTQPIDILNADFVQYGSEPLVLHLHVK